MSASEMTPKGTPMPIPIFAELARPVSAGLADAFGVGLEVVEGPADDELAELQFVSEINFGQRIQSILWRGAYLVVVVLVEREEDVVVVGLLVLDVLLALVELGVLEGVVLVANVVLSGVGVALVDDTPLTTLKGFVNSVPTLPATAAVTSEGMLNCVRTTSKRKVPRIRRRKLK